MPAHVAAAASLSGLPWIILYFKPPKSLKTQGQRKFVGEAFKDITQVPFEVVKGVPDPARLLYVWVKVFGGMSVKFDILRITLITPQLGLEELFGPHSPQELANIIADYVQVPGDRVGDDEAIAPRADTELIRLYFLMRDAETYIGQIPEMGWPSHPAAPVKMPHGRTHYAKEPSELRKDLQTSMPQ
jgi:hypothetical protein